jgi:hypothetical protein
MFKFITQITQITQITPGNLRNRFLIQTGAAVGRKFDWGSALVAIINIALGEFFIKKFGALHVFASLSNERNAIAFFHRGHVEAAGGLIDELIDLREHFVDTLLQLAT